MKKFSSFELFKRPIEILSLIEREQQAHSVHDLRALFHWETPTINRDLPSLRSLGFDNHSSNNSFINLFVFFPAKNETRHSYFYRKSSLFIR